MRIPTELVSRVEAYTQRISKEDVKKDDERSAEEEFSDSSEIVDLIFLSNPLPMGNDKPTRAFPESPLTQQPLSVWENLADIQAKLEGISRGMENAEKHSQLTWDFLKELRQSSLAPGSISVVDVSAHSTGMAISPGIEDVEAELEAKEPLEVKPEPELEDLETDAPKDDEAGTITYIGESEFLAADEAVEADVELEAVEDVEAELEAELEADVENASVEAQVTIQIEEAQAESSPESLETELGEEIDEELVSELAEPIEEVVETQTQAQGSVLFPIQVPEQPEQQNGISQDAKDFAQTVFTAWKKLAGSKDENWGVSVPISAIYQSEFQYLIAISFLAKLAAIRDVEVVWGCKVRFLEDGSPTHAVGEDQYSSLTFDKPGSLLSRLIEPIQSERQNSTSTVLQNNTRISTDPSEPFTFTLNEGWHLDPPPMETVEIPDPKPTRSSLFSKIRRIVGH